MTVVARVDLTPKDGMNKTERAYSQVLEAQRRDGRIHAWWYEAVTVKLGHDCRFTPDFFVIRADGACEFHETKGHMRDDALVKLKVCARQFPFPLYLVKKVGTGFSVNPVPP